MYFILGGYLNDRCRRRNQRRLRQDHHRHEPSGHAALNGSDVLLIDADDQETASDFTMLRNERAAAAATYTSIKLTGQAVRTETLRLADKYADVFIDTGGRDTTSQRAALTVADVLLVPFVPRSFDVWTLEESRRARGRDAAPPIPTSTPTSLSTALIQVEGITTRPRRSCATPTACNSSTPPSVPAKPSATPRPRAWRSPSCGRRTPRRPMRLAHYIDIFLISYKYRIDMIRVYS